MYSINRVRTRTRAPVRSTNMTHWGAGVWLSEASLAWSLESLLGVLHGPLTAAQGGPSNAIAPSGSTRGRGDQTADSGPAQVDPVRAVYRGENVCGSPARGRLRAARAVPRINLRSLRRTRISAISDPETLEPALSSCAGN